MDFEILANNGFIVCANQEGKFLVEKRPSKLNKLEVKPIEFDTFKDSIDYIHSIFNKNKEWKTIVRFNRGLGIEYKNIEPIIAESKEEAKKIAYEQIEKLLGDSIIEIKVAPILRQI